MKKLIFAITPFLLLIWTIGQVRAGEPAPVIPDPAVTPTILGDSQDVSQQKVSPIEERQRFNKLSKSAPQIYKVTMRSNIVYKLQTAIGNISLIDLPEEALKVFIGDADLFKVEVYEKEVLIKPLTDLEDAQTNLTIFTDSGRLSFNVTVGPPATADYVLDFRLPVEEAIVDNAFKKALNQKYGELENEFVEKTRKMDESVKSMALQKMRAEISQGAQVIHLSKSDSRGDVKLELLTLSKVGEKDYLSFKIENHSKHSYKTSYAVLGFERTQKVWFGLRKVPAGFREISSDLDIKSPVGPGETIYGVLMFEHQTKDKKETPVFRLFEEDGDQNFKIRGFKWIS